MADSFIRHPIDLSSKEVKVIWSQDLTRVEKYIIGVHHISPQGLSKMLGLQLFYNDKLSNQQLLEDLFVAVAVLRAKIIKRHCQ